MEPIPHNLEHIVRLLQEEWRTGCQNSEYLRLLEEAATRAASHGAVEARLAETAGSDADPVVLAFLHEYGQRHWLEASRHAS